MKRFLATVAALAVSFLPVTILAQMGGGGPHFDGAMAKLFGDNSAFTANVEMHVAMPNGGTAVMPGKLAFSDGKSRFEMDMADMKGGNIPPGAAAQMKQMGMSKMVAVSRPDKKETDLFYPDLKSYVAMPMNDSAAATGKDFKTEVTKVGSETVDGHDCVKNSVAVTGPDGTKHQFTVWNASDLKKFPVKITSTTPQGGELAMLFKDVKLEKPATSAFELPADYKKYDDMMKLMMSHRPAAPPQ